MPDVLEAIDPDVPNIEYLWELVENDRVPSPKLVELMESYGGQAVFEVYSSEISARQGAVSWATTSWIEVAYGATTKVGLIVWNSGVPADAGSEIPEQAIAGWPDCDSPEHAIERQQAKLAEDGKPPIVGITRCFDGEELHFRVLGYEQPEEDRQ
ncbi:hypothetical protein [Neorhizobium tomejilense]|uniref:hypothetical protein n=1 Tax=Neorhizobium tomejilense TaxID=2093828 RepID=UPI000CF98483|nr:hypothetical protein [Neorhizobium tomejilense]